MSMKSFVSKVSITSVLLLHIKYIPKSADGSGIFITLKTSFLPMRQSLFYFSGAEKFCLTPGLRLLTRDVKITSEHLLYK